MCIYVVEQKDNKYVIIGNADKFKVNCKLKLVLFKQGFENVAMYKLEEIKNVHKFDCIEQYMKHRELKEKEWVIK